MARHTCVSERRCSAAEAFPSGNVRPMAGAMRKMAVYLGLVEDEDPEFYDEDGYDDPAGAVARRGDAPAPLRVTRPDETAVSYTPPRRAAAEAVGLPHHDHAPAHL